jgi:hypothetical protein
MPDVFISYTGADVQLARYVHQHLQKHGLDVFMAEISLHPGQQWSEAIWSNLRASPWVLVLASAAACTSPYVQQEFGIAVGSALAASGKTIIPVVWDIDPARLPGWMSRFQALDLRANLVNRLGPSLDRIAVRIHADKQQGALVVGAFVAALLLLAMSER